MKRLLALSIIMLAAVAVGAQTNQHYTVTYTPSPSVFTGPTNVTVSPDAYNVYVTTNISLPFSSWTLAVVAPAEVVNSGSSNYLATTSTGFFIQMQPPIFVSMTYSNGTGTSPFSNIGGLQGFSQPGAIRSISSP